MKVIRVDNYDHEGPCGTQRVVGGPGLSLDVAERLARDMNDDRKRSDHDWFRVVSDDEPLFVFKP